MSQFVVLLYFVFHVGKKTRKKIRLVALMSGSIVVFPPLIAYIQNQFSADGGDWFFSLFQHEHMNGIVLAPLMFLCGALLLCISVLTSSEIQDLKGTEIYDAIM